MCDGILFFIIYFYNIVTLTLACVCGSHTKYAPYVQMNCFLSLSSLCKLLFLIYFFFALFISCYFKTICFFHLCFKMRSFAEIKFTSEHRKIIQNRWKITQRHYLEEMFQQESGNLITN